jgi:hypothetical protein
MGSLCLHPFVLERPIFEFIELLVYDPYIRPYYVRIDSRDPRELLQIPRDAPIVPLKTEESDIDPDRLCW